MGAFGIKAIQPQDNEHILGFATARDTADESLLEVWNGPTNSDLVYTIDKAGQLQGANGTLARPTYSFEADKDSGRYMSAAGTFLDVIAGTAVGTWTAGKLTLTELAVDNININANTISSTSGAVNIVPVSGSAILLDGAISIDAGVVTGATSITSTAFVGTLTGTAGVATKVTVTEDETTDENNAVLFGSGGDPGDEDSNLFLESDGGAFHYNPSTEKLTVRGSIAGGDITLADDKALKVGTGSDATLLYDGTHMIAKPNASGTGALLVTTGTGVIPGLDGTTTLVVQRNQSSGADVRLTLLAGAASNAILNFADAGNEDQGNIGYNHLTDAMTLRVNNATRMTIDSSGNVGIGVTSMSYKLDVSGTVRIVGLPDSEPATTGALWNDSGTIKIKEA